MSEKQAIYNTAADDLAAAGYVEEAVEMLGKGYDHSAPPAEIFGTMSGYTPAPDTLCRKYGYVTALVWGRVWRYCQGRDRVCRAKLETIAESLGMSERTIIRHMEILCGGGYFEDKTPELKNKPHIYADTGKLRLAFSTDIVESGVTESQRRVTESQRQGDRESVEDSIKRESKRLNSINGDENKKPTVPEGFPIEWLIAHGMPAEQGGKPVRQEWVDKLVKAKEACDKFEQAFGFGQLPWSATTTWEKFERFVVETYTKYPTMFQEYVDWSKDKTKGSGGFYKHMSNKQIRSNPQAFMDTGYPEFEASKMYRKGDSNVRENPGNNQKATEPQFTEAQLERGRRILERQRERAEAGAKG